MKPYIVPKECKHVKTCSIPVEQDHYEHICNTQCWIHCDFIKPQDLQPYKKSAPEWTKILGEEEMKSES